ncbi:TPA: hypothetical protein QEL76_000255 [Stenotrophomonas maltophilia]|nr:hypothetical protein [Stenotrophomonas maltophilia]
MDKAARRAAERAANNLLKAAGCDANGKAFRSAMSKKRKAAHEACQGKKTGKMRGSLARRSMG